MHGDFQKSEDVGGHGGQSKVVTLRPDLRHQHALAHVCGEDASATGSDVTGGGVSSPSCAETCRRVWSRKAPRPLWA